MTDYAALAAQYGGTPDQPDYGTIAQKYGGTPISSQPTKIGADAFPDFLRAELANTDAGTRNIAAFGTALSNVWEGLKQFTGNADPQQIQANQIIEKAAPVGAVAGNAALSAIPFGLAGNGLKAATAVGAAMGAIQPVQGDQGFENVAKGKLINAGIGGATALAGQAVANKAGDLVNQKLASLELQKSLQAPKIQALNDGLDAGLVVPPSEVDPSLLNTIKESIAGKAAVAQSASNRNSTAFDMLARRAAGLAPDAAIEPAALQAVRSQAYETGYKPIADMAAVNWDPTLIKGLQQLAPTSGAIKSPAQAQIGEMVDALTNQKQWTGQELIGDIQKLREISRASSSSAAAAGGDVAKSDLGRAAKSAADMLEQLGERNIVSQGGSPGAVDALRNARQLIAQNHDVEDALVQGSGSIDPRVLARKLQNGDFLTGDLATIAKFANNYKRAAQPVAQIGAPGVSKLDALMAMGGGAAGTAIGGPFAAPLGAAAPFLVPRALRAQMFSKGSQNALRDVLQLGLAPRIANGLLQYAPVGGTVLGLQALGQ